MGIQITMLTLQPEILSLCSKCMMNRSPCTVSNRESRQYVDNELPWARRSALSECSCEMERERKVGNYRHQSFVLIINRRGMWEGYERSWLQKRHIKSPSLQEKQCPISPEESQLKFLVWLTSSSNHAINLGNLVPCSERAIFRHIKDHAKVLNFWTFT